MSSLLPPVPLGRRGLPLDGGGVWLRVGGSRHVGLVGLAGWCFVGLLGGGGGIFGHVCGPCFPPGLIALGAGCRLGGPPALAGGACSCGGLGLPSPQQVSTDVERLEWRWTPDTSCGLGGVAIAGGRLGLAPCGEVAAPDVVVGLSDN